MDLTYTRAPSSRAVALCPVRVALMHTIRMGWKACVAWLPGWLPLGWLPPLAWLLPLVGLLPLAGLPPSAGPGWACCCSLHWAVACMYLQEGKQPQWQHVQLQVIQLKPSAAREVQLAKCSSISQNRL